MGLGGSPRVLLDVVPKPAPELDFTLGARPEHRTAAEAGAYFVRALLQLRGIDFLALDEEQRVSYLVAQSAYVRVCKGARRNRRVLERRRKATDAWVDRQLALGRSLWGVSPPETVFAAAGIPTPQPAVAPVARPRESTPRVRRRGGASRGGDSGDPPRLPSSDLARPRRVSRRGGAR